MLGLLLQLGYVPIVTFVIPKSPEQGPRLFLPIKTVVRGRFLVGRLGSAQVRAVLPRKPCSAGKVSWLNAQARTGNRGPCQVFGLMLGFVLRAGFAENTVLRAGSWAKCLGPHRVCRENRAL